MFFRFFFIVVASLGTPQVIAGDVQVVDNFLSLEESDALLQKAKDQFVSQTSHRHGLGSRLQAKVQLNKGIHKRLVDSMVCMAEAVCLSDQNDQLSTNDAENTDYEIVPITSIIEPTTPHQDSLVDPNAQVDNPNEFKTGFIFLDDNPEGYFQYGNSTAIEVKKGSLVVFDNDVPHHTFIPPAADDAPQLNPVYLLGPFTVTSDFGLTPVGGCAFSYYMNSYGLRTAGDYINVDDFANLTFRCAVQIQASKKNNRQKCRLLQFSCRRNRAYLGPSGSSPRLLNSSNPTQDPGLGTPNANCTPSGPGIGAAGASDMPYSNCAARENVLIIQQKSKNMAEPNSWSYGGTITFTFLGGTGPDGSSLVAWIEILGLDSGGQVTLVVRRNNGYADQNFVVNGGGANSYMRINVGLSFVTSMSITATSSFAIGNLRYN